MKVDIFNTANKYSIIYADPPWKFGSKELQKYDKERFRSLDRVYSTEKTEDMAQWNIKRIANSDSALFLWTTDAHIKEALYLIEAWGFKYKTVAFVWEKKSKNGKTLSTLGAWTLKNCELCLLATRGQMLQFKTSNQVRQLVKAERTIHSKKPDIVRNLIQDLFGGLSYIELFARQHYDGWDCWGNEV